MTPTHVHLGNDGGAVMDLPATTMSIEFFSVVDVDIQTNDGRTEPGILASARGERDDGPFRIDTVMTLEQAEDYVMATAHAIDAARRRAMG